MTKVVITGFSVFAGVTKNPTEDIVNHLKDWHLDDCDISTTVLECSVEVLSEFLKELDKNLLSWSPAENILLCHSQFIIGRYQVKS